jgi:hypothetical protein
MRASDVASLVLAAAGVACSRPAPPAVAAEPPASVVAPTPPEVIAKVAERAPLFRATLPAGQASCPSDGVPCVDRETAARMTRQFDRLVDQLPERLIPSLPGVVMVWRDVPRDAGWPTEPDERGEVRHRLDTLEGRVDASFTCLRLYGQAFCDHREVDPTGALALRLDDGQEREARFRMWQGIILSIDDRSVCTSSTNLYDSTPDGTWWRPGTGDCYEASSMFGVGRPYAGGRTASLVGDPGRATARCWAAIAAAEHASIASFARHVLELMAIGAPLALVQAATGAQQDEIRHAALALDLARAFGADVDLGPLPTGFPARTALVDVLLGVAREGCLGETASVMEAAVALEQTEDPRVRAVLATIVADEARHAALAWETLRWGLPRLDAEDQTRVLTVLATTLPAREGVLLSAEQVGAVDRWTRVAVLDPATDALRALVA